MKRLVWWAMSPGTQLMRRMRLPAKLAMVGALSLVPLVIMVVQSFQADLKNLHYTAGETEGARVVVSIIDVIALTQTHRGQMNVLLSGDGSVKEAAQQTRAQLGKALAEWNARMAPMEAMGMPRDWRAVHDELKQLANGDGGQQRTEVFQRHTDLIERMRMVLFSVADLSGLLLDPEPVTFFMMDLVVQRVVPWAEGVGVLRDTGAGLLARGEATGRELGALFGTRASVDSQLRNARAVVASLERSGEKAPASYATATQATEAFVSLVDRSFANGRPDGEPSPFFAAGSQAIDVVRTLAGASATRLEALLIERQSAILRGLVIDAVVSALGVLVVAYVMYAFYLTFMRAVTRLHSGVVATAKGDLTTRVDIWGRDELAMIGTELEGMNARVSALVANIRSVSVMVARSGEALVTGARDLSARTEQQAASLEQTSASVQELSKTVHDNAGSAQSADQLATRVQGIVESGDTAMREAVESMSGIQSSARRVQDIVAVIDGIAFQTNILALNAAVEAARAGESGRGFAVVASEVRTLAQRSASAAKEIRDLIGASVQQVDTGVHRITDASRTLQSVVAGMRDVAQNVRSISSASAEQSTSLSQISMAIASLDTITQQNAQLVEETSRSSEELGERAGRLASAVSAFRLRQGTADEAHALVERAVALYQQHGRAALDMITRDGKNFADRDMYVFAFDREGFYRAFGGNPAKVGVDLRTVPGLDGAKLVRDAFDRTAHGAGVWVDYDIVVPGTGAIQPKTSYVVAVTPDLVLGCGVYKYA